MFGLISLKKRRPKRGHSGRRANSINCNKKGLIRRKENSSNDKGGEVLEQCLLLAWSIHQQMRQTAIRNDMVITEAAVLWDGGKWVTSGVILCFCL